MTAPFVTIRKQDGNTGAVRPLPTGVTAIIAASASGTANQAGGFARQDLALAAFGNGPLAEYAAYVLATGGNPVILIKPTATTAGAYSNLVTSGVVGTCVITTAGTPIDEYAPVSVTVVTGGTRGTTGITYTYSLGPGHVSPVFALGTATSITCYLPNAYTATTGVTFNIAAGTLVAGDTWSVYTTRPQMTNSDLVTALEALRTTQLPWENVLIDMDATSTTVSTVDTWLSGLEAVGQAHGAFLNSRHKTVPVPTGESESAFATAMGTAFNTSSSIRLAMGTDAGDLPSPVTGVSQPRPVSLAAAGRLAGVSPGTDAAYVADGAITGFGVADSNGNPRWHDEQLYPGLDSIRLSTFRSIPGNNGTFLTNVNVLSPAGSDYVYFQHIRCMNIAFNIGFAALTTQLSKGVGKQPPDPVTKAIYILEQDAETIDQLVTSAMQRALKGQVVNVAFRLSRTDDLSPNSGAIVTGEIQVEALAYIKGITVTAKYVKSITVAA